MDSILLKDQFNLSSWCNQSKSLKNAYVVISIASISINIISALLSILQNLLVLLIIQNKNNRSPSHLLLWNLALTDFLTGLVTQPLYILHIAYDIKCDSSYFVLGCFSFVAYLFSGVSLLTVVGLSMDRLFATLKPIVYRTSNRRGIYKGFIVLIWLSIILGCSTFFLKLSGHVFGRIAFVLIVTLTFIVFFVSYTVILRTTHESGKKTDVGTKNARLDNSSQVRLTKSFAVLAVLLCVMYLPMSVIKIVFWVTNGSAVYSLGLANRLANTILFINSAVNPAIYCYRHRNIRQEMKQLLTRINIFSAYFSHRVSTENEVSRIRSRTMGPTPATISGMHLHRNQRLRSVTM